MLALLFLLKEVKPFPGPKMTKFLTFDNLFFLFTNLRKKADGEGGGGGGGGITNGGSINVGFL